MSAGPTASARRAGQIVPSAPKPHLKGAAPPDTGRIPCGGDERHRMPRAAAAMDEQDLERGLLRKSVGVLVAGRDRCADCGRTPLVGETVHVFSASVAVCELCRPLRGGDPEHSERVRHSESGQAVRVRRVRPA